MEDLAWLRDEVNEPLGFVPSLEQRPVARTGWKMLPIIPPALVAVAMAAFTFGRYDAQPRAEWPGARTAPPPASARAEPTPSQEPVAVDRPAPQAAATADQLQASSSLKVTQQGGGAAPMPLIIDVQQALAAARAKAAVQR